MALGTDICREFKLKVQIAELKELIDTDRIIKKEDYRNAEAFLNAFTLLKHKVDSLYRLTQGIE